jgi:GT2 family glycosyltransferase
MDSRPSPLVSVISLTYNRKDQIAKLLLSLRQQEYDPFEVIVVDNASTDGTADFIGSEFPEVRLLRSPENLRNHSYNLGIEAAEGVYLLMMDDDGLPAEVDWIARVVTQFEANPRLGAVACTIRMKDTGRIAHDSPQFVPEGSLESGYPCAAYNGTGAGLRATAVRGLMPVYPKPSFHSWIELHLCTRLLQDGWDVRHFPDIEVWHNRASGSGVPTLAYHGLCNYYWYVWQFYPWPHVLSETLHELSSRLKLAVQGQMPFRHYWHATRDAFLGSRAALTQRQPISKKTLAYLRRVRRHGNWHGIVPETVAFHDSIQTADAGSRESPAGVTTHTENLW